MHMNKMFYHILLITNVSIAFAFIRIAHKSKVI